MMPIGDPSDRFFYLHHTRMKDTYYLKHRQLNILSYIKEYSLSKFPTFLLISTPVISNYWYLTVNFLGQENYSEVSVLGNEIQLLRYK